MSTDRELLQAAARAIGLYDDGYLAQYREGEGWLCIRPADDKCMFQSIWAPLSDDGDALRLLTELRLSLIPIEGGGWDVHRYDFESCIETMLGTDNDPKRAIVRAAAALGEQHDQ